MKCEQIKDKSSVKYFYTLIYLVAISISNSIYAKSLYFAKTNSEINFSSIDTSPEGFSVGYQDGGESYEWYVEYQSSKDNQKKFEYDAFNVGTNFDFSTIQNVSYGLNIEVGLGNADLKTSSNEFDYLTLSSGGFADIDLLKQLVFLRDYNILFILNQLLILFAMMEPLQIVLGEELVRVMAVFHF